MMIRALSVGSMLLLTCPLWASTTEFQQSDPGRTQTITTSETVETTTADTRVQQIEQARELKESNLQPEAEPKLQHDIKWAQSRLPYKLLTSKLKGVGLGFGNTGSSGGGFAIGPQFSRSDFMNGRAAVRIGARGSTNRSYLGTIDFSLRNFVGGRFF